MTETTEYVPPCIENACKVEIPFAAMQVLSKVDKLNGVQPKRIECKVVLDLNGNVKIARTIRRDASLVTGVPDCDIQKVRERIFRNVGRCCFTCEVRPYTERKRMQDYIGIIDKACVLAISNGIKENMMR